MIAPFRWLRRQLAYDPTREFRADLAVLALDDMAKGLAERRDQLRRIMEQPEADSDRATDEG